MQEQMKMQFFMQQQMQTFPSTQFTSNQNTGVSAPGTSSQSSSEVNKKSKKSSQSTTKSKSKSKNKDSEKSVKKSKQKSSRQGKYFNVFIHHAHL